MNRGLVKIPIFAIGREESVGKRGKEFLKFPKDSRCERGRGERL